MPSSITNGVFLKKSALVVIGTMVVAASYYGLQEPNGIVAPGLGGIAMVLSKWIPFSLGVIYFALNIPLFLIGYRSVGALFAVFSLIGMSSLSICLGLFKGMPGLHMPLVGCILSGILSGIGIGVVIKAGGTTGGLDIVSVVISRISPRFSIGKTMVAVNGFVLLCSFLSEGFEKAFYTLASMFLAGKSVDAVLSYTKTLGNGGEINGE
ncbi:YitT family protein [Neobacillus drentensis]|uniref:YitT family protein n=1 Tax=Neobacillus drentensis TaxID=220684 RepID=UPI002FFF8A97